MNRDQSYAGGGLDISSYYELLKLLQPSSSSPGQDFRRLPGPVSTLSHTVSGTSSLNQDFHIQVEPAVGHALSHDRPDYNSVGHISRHSIGSGYNTTQGALRISKQ